jgi:hypothetical protein
MRGFMNKLKASKGVNDVEGVTGRDQQLSVWAASVPAPHLHWPLDVTLVEREG